MSKANATCSGDTLPMMTRALPVGTIQREARTFDVVWTTGASVRRYDYWREEYYDEQLIVTPDAVDMSRLNNGAPFLNQHSSWSLSDVLGVVERAWLDGGEGRATIRFPQEGVSDTADRIFALIADGIIRNISVGYTISKVEREKRDGLPTLWRITKWEPYEISAVGVGADDGGKIRADEAEKSFPVTFIDSAERAHTTESKMQNTNSDAEQITETRAVPTADTNVAAALTAERARVRDLGDIATRSGLGREVLDAAISDGTTVEAFRARAFEHLAAASNATRTGNVATSQITADGRDKYVEGATRALLLRAGIAGAGERNEFSGMSLARLAEESIRVAGGRVRSFGLQMVGEAFTLGRAGGAHASGDFPLILENVANKSMLAGWETADTTYQIWTKKGSLSDFKIAHRYGVGPLPMLKRRPEGAKYEYASLSENKATVMLATYGRVFAITRELVINDDLSALSDIPMKQGRAARMTVDSLPYALINANASFAGGAALFHASRKNLAAAAAAPSAASFSAAGKAMRKGHTAGSDGSTRLRISPKYGLFPEELRDDVLTLLSSKTLLGQANPEVKNPAQGYVEPVFSDWLDDESLTAWYFAADKGLDTIEVSFLDGNDAPFLDQQQGWQVDGTEFKVRIDAGASVLDPRGLYKNAGAA